MAASEESKGGGGAHKGLSASSSTGGGEEEREREIMERESRIEAAAAEDVEEGEILDDDEEGDEAGGGGRSPATPLEPLPLENSWTFWFDSLSSKSKQSAWGTSLRSVHTFSTVQDFWSLYNNIRPPSKLEAGADLYCFKCKIEPKWEDPICANGGKWTIICPRGRFDTTWLYTLLALIGEQFDCGDEICGAVVNVRKQDRISLWTKNATNEAAQTSIGKQWKELVDCNDTIGFIVHDEAKRLERGAKNRYSV